MLKPRPPTVTLKKAAQTVKTGMDTHERLTFNFALPNCTQLPTFFVYDRLNIPDLIRFSGTDFMQSWSLDFVLVQTNLVLLVPELICPTNRQGIALLPYMAAVESGDCV